MNLRAFVSLLSFWAVAGHAVEIVEQVSTDISIVKAFNTGLKIADKNLQTVSTQIPLKLEECKILKEEPNSSGTRLLLDCTEALEKTIKLKAVDYAAPVIPLKPIYALRAPGSEMRSDFVCHLTEIQTATEEKSFNDADGIGFYFDGTISYFSKTTPKGLQYISSYKQDGLTYLVHRFQTAAFCFEGSVTSSMQKKYEFKAYLQFSDGQGQIFRNWEDVKDNHWLRLKDKQSL